MCALPEISLLRHLHTAKVAIAAALGLLLDLAAVLLALLALSRNLSCHYGTDVRSGIAWRGEQRDLEVSRTRKSEVVGGGIICVGRFPPPPLQRYDPPELGLLILSAHLLHLPFLLSTIYILEGRVY